MTVRCREPEIEVRDQRSDVRGRNIRMVIPAQAGIQTPLDTRFRGYDGCFDNSSEFWLLTSYSMPYAPCSMP